MNRNFYSAVTLASVLAVGTSAQAALVGHWTFDDAGPDGDLTFDSAGTNNNGTKPGNTLAAAASSKIGPGAVNLGGQGQGTGYINLDSTGDFSINTSINDTHSGLTMAFWYKAPADQKVAATRHAVHFVGSGGNSAAVELNNGTARGFFRNQGSTSVNPVGTTDIFTDTWHHVVVTYTSSTGAGAVYIDGKLDATATNANVGKTLAFTAGRIGMHQSDATRDVGGFMDDTGIWNDALSAQQIALIHGLGHFTGINLADGGIAAVLAAFNAEGTAAAGGYDWKYTTGLSGIVGSIGGSIATEDAYIVLDASGHGVQLSVPEPGTLALLGGGVLLGLARPSTGRRSRNWS